MALTPETGLSAPSPEAVRAQLERLLSSDVFRDAPTQQRLLRYLVERGLNGEANTVKEYTIGAEVFQRSADFDPRSDSIVRVQMGTLRKKLKLYYEGPGLDDAVQIEIPRGTYAPSFSGREPRPAPEPPPPPPPPPRRISPWVFVAVGIVCGVLAMLAADHFRTPPKAPVVEWRDHPLWQGFLEPGATNRLVIGAPLLLQAGNSIIRDTHINQPEQLANNERVKKLEATLGASIYPTELYTGLGEAAGINFLTRFFTASSSSLPLLRNRLTKWQDLTNGNVIFLASLRFRTLGQELSLPSDFEFAELAPAGVAIRVRNPRQGENAQYASEIRRAKSGSGLEGTDYAMVSVWPGTLAGRRIMNIGGSHTWGTEGAAEFVTDPPSLRELRAKVGKAPSDRAALQVLLRVGLRDSQIASTSYVTHHWIE